MANDLLITPASRKLELKDSSGNIDAKIETDGSGNLQITNAGGSITLGTADTNLFIPGNLVITGDLNSNNTTDLDITDKTITLAKGANEAGSDGAGIVVDGSGASILWDEPNDEWDFNKKANFAVTPKVGTATILTDNAGLNANNISSGTLATARLSSHLDIGGRIDFNVGSNPGTTYNPDRLWSGQFTTGQSDVPGNYYDILNLSTSSTHGIQIASNYGSTASTPVYIRTRSDNASAPSGAGLQPWALVWTDRTDGPSSGLNADLLDDQQGAYYLNKANHTGTGAVGTTTPFQVEGGSVAWSETIQGQTLGSIHLDPAAGSTDPGANFGSAITFGASDTSSGDNAQAGIYVRSDGAYGTKMYFSTTNAYASGSKTFMYADHTGKVYLSRTGLLGDYIDARASSRTTTNTTSYFSTSVGAAGSGDDWQNSPISIRERGLVGSAQSGGQYSPNLNFHWGGRVSMSLSMDLNGDFHLGSYDTNGVPNQSTESGLSHLNVRGIKIGNVAVIDENQNVTGTVGTFTSNHSSTSSTLNLLATSNGSGAGIAFSDNGTPSTTSNQRGHIVFKHSDNSSFDSGASFSFESSESTFSVLVDGKLLFKEGLFIKPASGTGAGTLVIDSSRNITAAAITSTTGMTVASRTTFGSGGFFDNASNGNNVGIKTGGDHVFLTDGNGSIADGTKDIGIASRRVRNMYMTGTLNVGPVVATGDIISPGIYVGSANTSFDFYNNGTSYLNGTTEVNAELKISSSSSFTTHFNYLDGGNNIISQANGAATTIRNNGGDLLTLSSAGNLTIVGYGKFNNGVMTTSSRASTAYCHPLGHYSHGDEAFSIDPTWTSHQLQEFFNSTNVNWNADATAPDGYAIKITGAVNVGGVYGSGYPFISAGDVGDIYYMECYIRNEDSDQRHYMGGIEYSETFGAPSGGRGNPGSYGYFVMSNTNPGTSWTKVSGYIKNTGGSNTTGEFETGTNYFTPMALFNYTAGSGTRNCYISGWKCIKVNRPGGIHTVGGNDTQPTISATNLGGLNSVIQEWVGDSDKMEMFNESAGDYFLRNNQQNNGIFFADGTGGVSLRYNGSDVVRVDSNGGFRVLTGGLKIANVMTINTNRDYSGRIGDFTSSVSANLGSGGVSLTANDGYGNANVTFNHKSGTPEQNGQSARIVVNTDGTSTEALMEFEVSSSDVTSGSAVDLPVGLEVAHDYIAVPERIRHIGDTNTYLQFNANDSWRVVTGDEERLKANNGEVVVNDNSVDMDFRVESNGNANMLFVDGGNDKVGIGTATPAQKLHVEGATSIIHVQSTTANANASIWFNSKVGTTQANRWEIGTNISAAGDLEFFDRLNGVSRMVIEPDGNVGIATISPFSRLQSGAHTFSGTHGMHADSRVGISNHGSLTGMMLASTYNDATHPEYGLVFVQGPSTSSYNVWSISPDGPAKGDGLNFHYGSNITNVHSPGHHKITFKGSTGNVGIGNTNPNLPLTVTSNSGANAIAIRARSADDYGFIQFYNHAGTAVRGQIFNQNGAMQISTSSSGTARLFINTAGNVGIGNTNPGEKFTVGSANQQGDINLHIGGHRLIAFGWLPSANTATYSGYPAEIRHDPSAGALRFGIDPTSRSVNGTTGVTTVLTIKKEQRVHVQGISNDTIDETKGTMHLQASGGNGMIFGTIASSPYTSYIQSAFVQDTSVAQYNLALNPIGGNVGIGNSNPLDKLYVEDGDIGINNTSGRRYRLISEVGGGFTIRDQTASAGRLTIDTSGTVAIAGELEIANKLRHVGDNDTYFQFQSGGNSPRIVAGNNEITEWRNDRMQMTNKAITFSNWSNFSDSALTDINFNVLNAPIHIPAVNIGTNNKYLPILQGSAQHTQGYRTNYVFGGYKQGTTGANWGDGQTGFFMGMGGSDNNPTKEFRFTWDGRIWYTDAGAASYLDFDTANTLKFVADNNQTLLLTSSTATINANLTLATENTTGGNSIHLPRNGILSLYGDTSSHHSIGSRNQSNVNADDIMISSYGAVYIDLDSNNNNTSGADFVIGKHNVTSLNRFSVSGEDGDTIAAGDVTAFGSPSDIRLKENIELIADPIEKVLKLRGVTFNYKDTGKKSTGLIAQELEEVLPEVVYETHDINNKEDKFKAVRYGNTVGLLVEAIKEQQKLINRLEDRIKDLENKGE